MSKKNMSKKKTVAPTNSSAARTVILSVGAIVLILTPALLIGSSGQARQGFADAIHGFAGEVPTGLSESVEETLSPVPVSAEVSGLSEEAGAANLGASDLGQLTVSEDSVSGLIDAPQPGLDNVVRMVDDDSLFPDRKGIEAALTAVDRELAAEGLDGTVRLASGIGLSFFGEVPGFADPVDIQANINSPGAIEWFAKRDLALTSLREEDLPSDYPVGNVWLGERVAYGHGVGPGAEEWAVFDLGDEFILVRTHHFAGSEALLGMEIFIERSARLVDTVRSAGFTISADGTSNVEHRTMSSLFRDAATLRCSPQATECRPLGIVDSSD